MKTIHRDDAQALVGKLSKLSIEAGNRAEDLEAGDWDSGYFLGKQDAYKVAQLLVEDLVTEGDKGMNQTYDVRQELAAVKAALIEVLKELEQYRSHVKAEYNGDQPMYVNGAWAMHAQADQLLKTILDRIRWQM